MISRFYSAALRGVEAVEVEVEIHETGSTTPATVIVGLPDTAVRESAERVKAAIKNSGLPADGDRWVVNLAPADLRKEGPSFDLPIALGMICTSAKIQVSNASDWCLVGELALDGGLRPVRGVLSIALGAKMAGRACLVVPAANAAEAALIDGIKVFGVNTLAQAYELVVNGEGAGPIQLDRVSLFQKQRQHAFDFSDVKGQHQIKRAIEIAVAGNHNLIMAGSPGSGKSMLAKRIPTIMTDMTESEAIEATKIHSIAGALGTGVSLLTTRPFRSPHHTISDVGLIGGGSNPGPGEISLAHRGVLFLDELPEFKRTTLEVLRQPLEDRSIAITRAAGTLRFPCDFMLVAAMNPCPCGYLGHPKIQCRCSPKQISSYRAKISGPLMDRIDVQVEVPAVEYKDLSSKNLGESSEIIRARVAGAREIQGHRYADEMDGMTNASMSSKMLRQHCHLDTQTSALLENAMTQLQLSARAHDRILRVSRTIADLAGAEKIEAGHLLEALQCRNLERNARG